MQIYSLNRITNGHLLKYLEILGIPCSGEEDIEKTFEEFRKDLRRPYTAVTSEDFETIALAEPELKLTRAKAIVKTENKNIVTILIVPYASLETEKPTSSEELRKRVCKYLDKHRLITTQIKVDDPAYVRVSINTEIKIKPGYSPDLLRDRVNQSLNKFLSPVKRGSDYNEWPFGRPVYRSEVYEVIEGVEGVDCVLKLSLRGEEGEFKYENGNIMIGQVSLVYPGRHLIEIFEPKTICQG
jgi:predicted phage baseplate assembly protein